MTGYIRASLRFFHDRRVLVGSVLVLLLSLLTELYLYSRIVTESVMPELVPMLAVLGAFGWALAWGAVTAAAIVQDEWRSGSLELLLTTPVSPRQLVRAMAVAPMVITLALMSASLPMALFPLMAAHTTIPVNGLLLLSLFALAAVIAFFVTRWVTYASACVKSVGESVGPALVSSGGGIYFFVIVAFLLSGAVYGDAVQIRDLFDSGFLWFMLILMYTAPFFPVAKKRVLFDIESRVTAQDVVNRRTAGLWAFLRRHAGTIFEREEGVDKFLTVEQIRQQNLNGPLLMRENVRDLTVTLLVILFPFFLIALFIQSDWRLDVLQTMFGSVLSVCAFNTMNTAMREMLDERVSHRLDSIRVTLLPVEQVTEVKEKVAECLPAEFLRRAFYYGSVFALLYGFWNVFPVLFCILVYAAIAWLTIKLAARAGIWVGLLVKDELEGLMWTAVFLSAWVVLPVAAYRAAISIGVSGWLGRGVEGVLYLSPFGLVTALDPNRFTLPGTILSLAVIVLICLVCQLLNLGNLRRIRNAWN